MYCFFFPSEFCLLSFVSPFVVANLFISEACQNARVQAFRSSSALLYGNVCLHHFEPSLRAGLPLSFPFVGVTELLLCLTACLLPSSFSVAPVFRLNSV